MTTILTIANQKGGVGKSSTCVSLAHGLALKGKRVLVIDSDPQGNIATLLGLRQESGFFDLMVGEDPVDQVIRPTGRDRLWIIPGDKRTKTVENVITSEKREISCLRDALSPALRSDQLDYIVIDTSPSLSDIHEAALWAADLVLIPSAVDFLSVEGALKLSGTLQTIKAKHGWSGMLAGVLPTFYDEATRESKTVLADLKAKFGARNVLDVIHRAVILREAAAFGQTVFELDGASRAATEYQALVSHILKITK